MYENKLRKILNKIPHVAVTTDIWTSMNMKSYLGVTCHFIKHYNLFSAVLETEQGEAIAEVINLLF